MKRSVLVLLLCLGCAVSASAGPFTIYQGVAPGVQSSAFWVGFAPQPEPPGTPIGIGAIDGTARFWVKFAPQPEPPGAPKWGTIANDNIMDLWVGATWGVEPSPFLFLLLDGFGSGKVPLALTITPCLVGSGAVCPSDSWLFEVRNAPNEPSPSVSYPTLHSIEVSFFGPTTRPGGSDNHPLDLAPVPEPASLLLLGTGLVSLAVWRKRRG